ncbi:hypothetical protein FS837_008776 [Tulasnella sp. UAMH 9824]|nr:hypothetical protein FS837_008776 [Tulasnella sp. UAMH 9824]
MSNSAASSSVSSKGKAELPAVDRQDGHIWGRETRGVGERPPPNPRGKAVHPIDNPPPPPPPLVPADPPSQ